MYLREATRKIERKTENKGEFVSREISENYKLPPLKLKLQQIGDLHQRLKIYLSIICL